MSTSAVFLQVCRVNGDFSRQKEPECLDTAASSHTHVSHLISLWLCLLFSLPSIPFLLFSSYRPQQPILLLRKEIAESIFYRYFLPPDTDTHSIINLAKPVKRIW